MNILFVSDNFPPESNAPASRTYEHAKRWVKQGIKVTVITCAPNFPQGVVYDGYRNKWRVIEDIDGIRVVRVKTFITSNEGFLLRILDYLSFMCSATVFGLIEKQSNLVVGTSPQLFAAAAAWFLSIFKRAPFVFELRDLWPASIVTVGAMQRGFLVTLLERFELFLYRRAAAIISVTESFKQDLVIRGIEEQKIHVVRNGVDLERFFPRSRSNSLVRDLKVEDKFVVGYFGTHGLAHGLENVLDTARLLADHSKVVFLLVGAGAEKSRLQALSSTMNLQNVIFHEPVPKESMPEFWSVINVALVHLKDDPVFSGVIPSKLFEAMGMGKPILLVQPDGEAANIVRRTESGAWIHPARPDELAEEILDWLSKPDQMERFSDNAKRASNSFSRDRLASEMASIMKKVATA